MDYSWLAILFIISCASLCIKNPQQEEDSKVFHPLAQSLNVPEQSVLKDLMALLSKDTDKLQNPFEGKKNN